MIRELLGRGWTGRLLILAMILVTAAVGFCLFDVHSDDHATGHRHAAGHHGMSVDLCAGLAIVSVSVVMALFCQFYSLPLDLPYPVLAVAVHRLDPPPRSPSLF